MGYVFKETELTSEQFQAFKPHVDAMRVAIHNSALKNADRGFLVYCVKEHVALFGGPKPNIQSGANILYMFKRLLNKINDYEKKAEHRTTETVEGETVADTTGTKPLLEKAKVGRLDDRSPRRRNGPHR